MKWRNLQLICSSMRPKTMENDVESLENRGKLQLLCSSIENALNSVGAQLLRMQLFWSPMQLIAAHLQLHAKSINPRRRRGEPEMTTLRGKPSPSKPIGMVGLFTNCSQNSTDLTVEKCYEIMNEL